MSVRHAIIMAAGTSSRFVPNCFEYPKGLTLVHGVPLIERQIGQLHDAGVEHIIVVTGHMAEEFEYLQTQRVILIHNPDYTTRNNHSSLYAARAYLEDCFICSADNYFTQNPFLEKPEQAYYSAVYADGPTDEWAIEFDENKRITDVTVGGEDAWVMLGHAFFSAEFGRKFRKYLEEEYPKADSINKFWENIFIDHLRDLAMDIKQYPDDFIFEFDSLDELRAFDPSFWDDPQSRIIEHLSERLEQPACAFKNFYPIRDGNTAIGFGFEVNEKHYTYVPDTDLLTLQDSQS